MSYSISKLIIVKGKLKYLIQILKGTNISWQWKIKSLVKQNIVCSLWHFYFLVKCKMDQLNRIEFQYPIYWVIL